MHLLMLQRQQRKNRLRNRQLVAKNGYLLKVPAFAGIFLEISRFVAELEQITG